MTVRRDVLYAVLMQVRPLTLASARVVETTWREHGVSVGMRAVLAVLATSGPARVPEVADRLDLTRQAVQRHVNDLRSLDLVAAHRNPAHRRSVLVALTDSGARLWREVHDQELSDLAPMAAGCSDADLTTTLHVLEALAGDVRARALALEGPGDADA